MLETEDMNIADFENLSPEEQSAIEAQLQAEEDEALTEQEWASLQAEQDAERAWFWRTTSPSWR